MTPLQLLVNLTRRTDVGDLEIRLEILRTRLGDGVHSGDKHWAFSASGADGLEVSCDVRVAAEGVCVVGCDAAASTQSSIQSFTD